MDFQQTAIPQPQTQKITLAIEITGAIDCTTSTQIVESFARVLRAQMQLANPHLRISYSIDSLSEASKSRVQVQLPRFLDA
ncbi:hypothetical protein B7486_51245 [cyanobacterium TDX16]|nr:hypothetical protein B7486_51245 [cyanobacterium TDX16]